MKRATRQLLGLAVASALIIGTADGVFAHGGFGSGYGPGRGGHHGMMAGPGGMGGPYGGLGLMARGYSVADTDQELEQLNTTLGITAEQAGAWSAYAEALKGRASLMAAHRQARFGSGGITADERLSFHQQGLAQMQKVIDASRDLYAVLTPEQRTKAEGLTGPRCAAW